MITSVDQAAELMSETRAWGASDVGHRWLRDYFSQLGERQQDRDIAKLLGGVFWEMCKAPTYWVSRDMLGLVEHSSRSMPEDPITEIELPTESGVALLPRPITRTFTSGRNNAVGWMWSSLISATGIPGVVLSIVGFSTHDTLVPLSYAFIPYGDRDGLRVSKEDMARIKDEIPEGREGEYVDEIAMVQTMMPRAMWSLCRQKLASMLVERPGRAVRRRAEKEGRPIEDVTVINLRKIDHKQGDSDGESDVEWTHRWMVSGHWRNQWVPSLNGHRHLWVSPYVKGPEDKPLVLKERRYALVR